MRIIDGIINLLKPPGMTSHDAVAFIRRLFKGDKVGHTGTLDPLAAGVLPICIGKGTRIAGFLTDTDKAYRAELILGKTTDTQDYSGTVTSENPVQVSLKQIQEILREFTGEIDQIPPMVSAVRHQGKKLYELARQGIEVERNSRQVKIYSIEVISEMLAGPVPKIVIDVACSKGTYIRTLCHDIGAALGCGGHMGFLLRIKSGVFDISQTVTFEEVQKAVEEKDTLLTQLVYPVDYPLKELTKVVVTEQAIPFLCNGVKLFPQQFKVEAAKVDKLEGNTLLRIYTPTGKFIALGRLEQVEIEDAEKSEYLIPVRVFAGG